MADSVKVRRANVILDIPDDDAVIDRYLGMGYDLLDASGRVAQKATSGKSAGELQQEIAELTEENKRLRAMIKKLKESKAEVSEAKPKRTKKAE